LTGAAFVRTIPRMTNVGVLGSGSVGQVLANGLLELGYAVMRGSRDPEKLALWAREAGPNASSGSFAEAAAHGELVVLAVKGTAAEDVVVACGDRLSGKTVIDTTNPIADSPPTHGVLSFFTGPNDSLLERLQKRAPQARFVKAFSCVGNGLMVHPQLGAKPSMFICGDDAGAKKTVSDVITRFGWEVEDVGASTAARAIEPLCMLWCIPGLVRGDWAHAYKVLRA